jgi:hypothetical protein
MTESTGADKWGQRYNELVHRAASTRNGEELSAFLEGVNALFSNIASEVHSMSELHYMDRRMLLTTELARNLTANLYASETYKNYVIGAYRNASAVLDNAINDYGLRLHKSSGTVNNLLRGEEQHHDGILKEGDKLRELLEANKREEKESIERLTGLLRKQGALTSEIKDYNEYVGSKGKLGR